MQNSKRESQFVSTPMRMELEGLADVWYEFKLPEKVG